MPFVGWTNIYKYESIIRYDLYWDENILSLQDTNYNFQAIVKGLKYEYAIEVPIDYFWRGPSDNNISNKINSNQHTNSHLYLIEKICSNNFIKKNRTINNDIKIFIIYFIDQFYSNKYFIKRLFSIQYIKKQILFNIQLKLYYILKKRGIRFIFPHLYKFRNIKYEEAELFRKEKLKQYIKITSKYLNIQL